MRAKLQVNYTAYGLKIAAISSTKISDPNEGNIDNKNLYNDKELLDDADLDWYDYGFRSYDAQIGRFPQLDPLTDDYPHYTPYQFAGNEPIANVDMDGLEEANILVPITVTSIRHLGQAATQTAGLGTKLAGWGARLALQATASLLQGKQNFVNNWSSWGHSAANFINHKVQVGKDNWNDGTFVKNLKSFLPNGDYPDAGIAGPVGLAAADMEVAYDALKAEKLIANELKGLSTEELIEQMSKFEAESITEKGLNALKNDLKKLQNLTRQDIAEVIKKDVPSLKYKGGSPDGRFMQWEDASGKTRLRIDPPDAKTQYDHIHIYDSKGNSLNMELNIKAVDSRDVHIKIKSN